MIAAPILEETDMRNLAIAAIATLGLALMILPGTARQAAADGCLICTSGSSCGQYCRYSGSDNSENRKKCRKAGCKIGGTASCPKGANIKICSAGLDRVRPNYAWIDDLLRFNAGTTRSAAQTAARGVR